MTILDQVQITDTSTEQSLSASKYRTEAGAFEYALGAVKATRCIVSVVSFIHLFAALFVTYRGALFRWEIALPAVSPLLRRQYVRRCRSMHSLQQDRSRRVLTGQAAACTRVSAWTTDFR